MKRSSNISLIILLFALIDIAYTLFCPPFPAVVKPEGYAFWRVIYYLNHYLIVAFLAYYFNKKTSLELDKLACFGLMLFSIGKLIFYIFLINKDLPTYIRALNSKSVDILFSFILWLLATAIWYYKYNFKKAFKKWTALNGL